MKRDKMLRETFEARPTLKNPTNPTLEDFRSFYDELGHWSIRLENAIEIKCGLCGSNSGELVGPYAGGPFSYYCERCGKMLDRYLDGRKKHEAFFRRLFAERDRKASSVQPSAEKGAEAVGG